MSSPGTERLALSLLLLLAGCTNDVSLGSTVDPADAKADADVVNHENCLAATPFRVEFGVVQRGELAEREIRVTNGCEGPVELTGFTLSGDLDFSVVVGTKRWKSSPETATAGVSFDTPWVVPGRGEVSASIAYEPSQPDPASGVLVWLATSGSSSTSLVVKLQANEQTPCIATQPKTLDYGGKVVGEVVTREVAVSSCGDGPLVVDALDLLDASGAPLAEGPFKLEVQSEPLPWTLEPGETRGLMLSYLPTEVAELNEEGERIRDRASLRIATNAFEGDHVVGVRGFGVTEPCPEAVIDFQSETVVSAATSVNFEGSGSWSTDGDIVGYEWSRVLPSGLVEDIAQGGAAQSVSIDFSMVGEHLVRLSVEDSTGLLSCAPAEVALSVAASAGLHVELLWSTPGDPDPHDEGFEKGSDLDLHLLHPLAVGEDVDGDGSGDGWFDDPLDTFWGNLQPNWGQVGDPKVTDDPHLLRDDVDSLGPEVIVLTEPQQGAVYRIGVHSWEEHGYGPSSARVRIWANDELVFSSEPVLLHAGDLWEVGSVDPSQDVMLPLLEPDGSPVIWQLEPSAVSEK